MQSWEVFRKNVIDALNSGIFRVSKPMTELDIAVQYVVGVMGEKNGYPCDTTKEELCQMVVDLCGEEVFEKTEEYGGW